MVLNRVWFSKEPRERINVFVFSTPNVEKEKYSKYIIRAEFYQYLTSLMMRSLITIQQRSENGYGFLGPGLKTGVENGIFWSEIGSGFGESGGTPLPKIPRSTPPPRVFILDDP